MIYKRFLSLSLTATLLLGAAACGGDDDDDGTGPSGSVLSAAEVEDAFTALSAAGLFDFGFSVDPLPTAIGLSGQSSGTYNINETNECPSGGAAALTGTISYSETSFSADIRQKHNGCKAPSETGRVWTFDGNPDLRIQMSLGGSSSNPTYNGSMTGGFKYSSDGKSGSCSANVNFNFNASGAGAITGTMCGQPVNETFSSF